MNQKGQAFVEATLLLILVTVSSLFLVRLGLQLQNEIVLDDLMKEALICQLQKKLACLADLKNKLQVINFKTVQAIDQSTPDHAKIYLKANSGLNITTTLHNELKLDLSVN